MRDAASRRGVGLGGADVHAAIDLRRIDADDLDRQPRASSSAIALLPDAVGPIRSTVGSMRGVPPAPWPTARA